MWHSLLTIILLALPASGYCAWEILSKFSGNVTSIYFLDAVGHPEIGFVVAGNGWFHRTVNGGIQWTAVVQVGGSTYGQDINKRRGKPPDELSSLQKTVVAEMKAGKAITIDLDQISSGMYSIECTYGGGRSILRAIVQR